MTTTQQPVALADLLTRLAEHVRPDAALPGTAVPPECDVCGGTGMYMLDVPALDPRYTAIMYCDCAAGQVIQDCIVQRYENGGPTPSRRAQAGMIPEYRARFERARFERLFNAAALPLDMQGYTFDTFKAQDELSPKQDAACNVARALAETGHIESRGVNRPALFLWSHEPGLGKTGLAAAIVNRRLQMGAACLFMSTPALFDRIRATFNDEADTSYDDMLGAVKNAPLLVLDDLDKTNRSEFVERVFFDVINHRYLHSAGRDHLVTVFTANMSPDDMAGHMNAATIDRIRAMSAVVEVVGVNLRK